MWAVSNPSYKTYEIRPIRRSGDPPDPAKGALNTIPPFSLVIQAIFLRIPGLSRTVFPTDGRMLSKSFLQN